MNRNSSSIIDKELTVYVPTEVTIMAVLADRDWRAGNESIKVTAKTRLFFFTLYYTVPCPRISVSYYNMFIFSSEHCMPDAHG
jgi:hypothetical protein